MERTLDFRMPVFLYYFQIWNLRYHMQSLSAMKYTADVDHSLSIDILKLTQFP